MNDRPSDLLTLIAEARRLVPDERHIWCSASETFESPYHAAAGHNFDLQIERQISIFRTSNGEEYWDIFSTDYGPTKTLADSLGARREEFHQTWVDFFEKDYRQGDEIVHDREWLLILGTKR